MEARMLPAQQWQLLLKAFLKSTVSDLDLEIEVVNKEIIINTKNREHLERLQKVLSSPEMAKASLEYTLTTSVAHAVVSSPKQEIFYPKPITVKPNSGKEIFRKIFGGKILNRVGRTKWSDELTNEDSRVLYCIVSKNLAELTALQTKAYRECLTSATFAELRAAFAKEKSEYKSLSLKKSSNAESKILATHIDKILYSKPNKNNNDVLYFDYGLLASCITAPIMEIQEEKTDDEGLVNYQMKISKNHLINYLSTVFEEGFIVHMNGDKGQPICFNMQRAVPMTNVIMLLLDRSSSMKASFPAFIKKVKAFIEHAHQDKNYADAEILIKAFSTEPDETQRFMLSDLTAINAYLDTLKAEGATALYTTVAKALAEVKPLLADKNVIVIPFTDGRNYNKNIANYGLDELNQQSNIIKQQAKPIKIYAIGYGDQYDADKLKELATITEGVHIKLDKIDDFSVIHAHVGEMSKARVIARFLQSIQEEAKSFNVITYEDELGVASGELQVPGNFSVGEMQYHIEPGGLQLIPAEKVKGNSRQEPMIELATLAGSSNNGLFPKRRNSAPSVVVLPEPAAHLGNSPR